MMPRTKLAAQGSVSFDPAAPSQLTISGPVSFSELNQLPFLNVSAIDRWQVDGLAQVSITFTGQPDRFEQAALEGWLRADQLSVKQIPLERFAMEFEQQRGTFRLRVPGSLLAGGQFDGDVAIEHLSPSHRFMTRMDLTGVQLALLKRSIKAWQTREVTGQASTHLLLSGIWEDRATWQGDGWLNGSGEGLGDLPLLEKVFRGLFGVLAERLGLETLRRAHITEAQASWRLADSRIATEDLRLGGTSGGEPIAIYGRGSVGLDRTLDLVIEPELSERVLLEAPTTKTLMSTVLKAAGQLDRLRRVVGRHRLTGTLDKPDYSFELSMDETIRQVGGAPAHLLESLFDAVRQ
jgi:hypothetical protein